MFLLCALCVFILSLGAPEPGHAASDSLLSRTDHPTRMQLAFRAGVTLTDLDYSDELTAGGTVESFTGWMYGADIRVRINETWWFESGLRGVRKGSRGRFSGPGVILGFPVRLDLEATASLTYIVLPARLKLMSRSRVKPYARLGLDLGLLVDATGHVTGTISTAPIDQESDIQDQVKGSELALAMEVGFEVPLGGGYAFLELTGSLGVTDVDSDADAIGRNRGVGVALGIAFSATP